MVWVRERTIPTENININDDNNIKNNISLSANSRDVESDFRAQLYI
jgi:hypothetical protein